MQQDHTKTTLYALAVLAQLTLMSSGEKQTQIMEQRLTIGHVRLNTYGRRVAGLMAWNSAPDFIQDPTTAQTVLGVYLKRTCSRDTSASSASGVLNDSVLYKSTHSLALCALDAA